MQSEKSETIFPEKYYEKNELPETQILKKKNRFDAMLAGQLEMNAAESTSSTEYSQDSSENMSSLQLDDVKPENLPPVSIKSELNDTELEQFSSYDSSLIQSQDTLLKMEEIDLMEESESMEEDKLPNPEFISCGPEAISDTCSNHSSSTTLTSCSDESETETEDHQPSSSRFVNTSTQTSLSLNSADTREKCKGFKGYEDIPSNTIMKQFTGVSKSFFSSLVVFLNELGYTKINKENKLMVFLMKLKMDLGMNGLSCLFQFHPATVSKTFLDILAILYDKTESWIQWPNKAELERKVPMAFRKFTTCKCLVDILEIPADEPSDLERRMDLYCHVKGKCVIKCLIAITPHGIICRRSRVYGGSKSNKFILEESGILDQLKPGDSVMMDSKFHRLEPLFRSNSINLLVPSLDEPDFSADDDSANIKALFDKTFRKLRSFAILGHFRAENVPLAEKIVHVCCVMANDRIPVS